MKESFPTTMEIFAAYAKHGASCEKWLPFVGTPMERSGAGEKHHNRAVGVLVRKGLVRISGFDGGIVLTEKGVELAGICRKCAK